MKSRGDTYWKLKHKNTLCIWITVVWTIFQSINYGYLDVRSALVSFQIRMISPSAFTFDSWLYKYTSWRQFNAVFDKYFWMWYKLFLRISVRRDFVWKLKSTESSPHNKTNIVMMSITISVINEVWWDCYYYLFAN